MIRRVAIVFLAVGAAGACRDFTPTVRQIEPGALAVTTAPSATIEVLDWGGNGIPLVFLAGGGHTAHEFDEFAPRLTDEFRVVGITRRGVGASSASRHQVARDGITDIAKVLEALEFESAVLIGHSQGGLEAAQFAEAYPERCLGIVHLDSAYLGGSRAVAEALGDALPPEPPGPTAADSESLSTMRAYIERTHGFPLPESEIRATNRLDDEGRVIGRAPHNTLPVDDRGGTLPPYRWEAIDCPSLGLYAVTAPLETWLPHYAARYDSLSVEERQQGQAYVRAFSAWTAEQRAFFGSFPQNEVVEFLASSHYFFLEQPEQERALLEIRRFASRLN